MKKLVKESLLNESFTIELGCPPGPPRPDDLLPGVLDGTGLEVEDFKIIAQSFGDWEWLLVNKEKEALYKEVQPKIKDKITGLYNSGAIRYGSW